MNMIGIDGGKYNLPDREVADDKKGKEYQLKFLRAINSMSCNNILVNNNGVYTNDSTDVFGQMPDIWNDRYQVEQNYAFINGLLLDTKRLPKRTSADTAADALLNQQRYTVFYDLGYMRAIQRLRSILGDRQTDLYIYPISSDGISASDTIKYDKLAGIRASKMLGPQAEAMGAQGAFGLSPDGPTTELEWGQWASDPRNIGMVKMEVAGERVRHLNKVGRLFNENWAPDLLASGFAICVTLPDSNGMPRYIPVRRIDAALPKNWKSPQEFGFHRAMTMPEIIAESGGQLSEKDFAEAERVAKANNGTFTRTGTHNVFTGMWMDHLHFDIVEENGQKRRAMPGEEPTGKQRYSVYFIGSYIVGTNTSDSPDSWIPVNWNVGLGSQMGRFPKFGEVRLPVAIASNEVFNNHVKPIARRAMERMEMILDLRLEFQRLVKNIIPPRILAPSEMMVAEFKGKKLSQAEFLRMAKAGVISYSLSMIADTLDINQAVSLSNLLKVSDAMIPDFTQIIGAIEYEYGELNKILGVTPAELGDISSDDPVRSLQIQMQAGESAHSGILFARDMLETDMTYTAYTQIAAKVREGDNMVMSAVLFGGAMPTEVELGPSDFPDDMMVRLEVRNSDAERQQFLNTLMQMKSSMQINEVDFMFIHGQRNLKVAAALLDARVAANAEKAQANQMQLVQAQTEGNANVAAQTADKKLQEKEIAAQALLEAQRMKSETEMSKSMATTNDNYVKLQSQVQQLNMTLQAMFERDRANAADKKKLKEMELEEQGKNDAD